MARGFHIVDAEDDGDLSDEDGEAADDSLDSDMRDAWVHMAGGYALLSREDELILAAARRLAPDRTPPPHADDCNSCATPQEALVLHNLRLILYIGKRYKPHTYNVQREDIWQMGISGLMKAADRFDDRRGNRFATQAMWWIRQSISRDLTNTGPMIREPVHVANDRVRALRTDDGALMPRTVAPQVVSLDEPLTNGTAGTCSTYTLADVLPDEQAEDPAALAASGDISGHVRSMLGHLWPRERLIIEMRYGLGTEDGRGWTLDECGRSLGMTRERVRQIQAQAEERLRALLAPHAPESVPRRKRTSSPRMVFSRPDTPRSVPTHAPNVVPKTRQRPAQSATSEPPQNLRSARASAKPRNRTANPVVRPPLSVAGTMPTAAAKTASGRKYTIAQPGSVKRATARRVS